MSYQPQPGTIAYRVCGHLSWLSKGEEVTSPVLLEAIGQPTDWQGLSPCMEPAIAAGVVTKRIEGRRAFWRLADGVDMSAVFADAPEPLNRPRSIQEHARTDSQSECARSHPHENMGAACQAKAEQARRTAADARIAEEQRYLRQLGTVDVEAPADPELTDVVDAEFVEVAISNTGRLLICNGPQQIALSPKQTEKVFQYLDEQRGVVWEAA